MEPKILQESSTVAESTSSTSLQTPSEINDFRGKYEFLSNFSRHPVQQDGLEFPTVEHAFQAAKCLNRESKMLILATNSPGVAKRVGQKVNLRPDWESVKVELMYDILMLKFAPGSALCDQLLATGDRKLVEGNNWHDNFWGSCYCDKHRGSPGNNVLGKQLMRVREERRLQLR